ncbi:MAG: hypothetical protein AAF562_09130, partial [Pseudomonadota bacterium]
RESDQVKGRNTSNKVMQRTIALFVQKGAFDQIRVFCWLGACGAAMRSIARRARRSQRETKTGLKGVSIYESTA